MISRAALGSRQWAPVQSRQVAARPYARAIDGAIELGPAIYGHVGLTTSNEVTSTPQDLSRYRLLCATTLTGGDHPLRTRWTDTVIYEMHVKGFTKLHPDIPKISAELRRTGAARCHRAPSPPWGQRR